MQKALKAIDISAEGKILFIRAFGVSFQRKNGTNTINSVITKAKGI